MTEISEKLLPCPFCDGEAELVQEHDHAWVRHKGCPADIGGFESALDAVTAWNRRAALSAAAIAREANAEGGEPVQRGSLQYQRNADGFLGTVYVPLAPQPSGPVEVKRYIINYDARGEQEHPSGDFVHYDDYVALHLALSALTASKPEQVVPSGWQPIGAWAHFYENKLISITLKADVAEAWKRASLDARQLAAPATGDIDA